MDNRVTAILHDLAGMGSARNRDGMARFGISVKTAFGVSMTDLRGYAKPLGRDHALAQQLWLSGRHEARLLATIIADPGQVTPALMEQWVLDFNSWDITDQACMNLFRKTDFAWDKQRQWATRPEEFVKRAGFALVATLAVHAKREPDQRFLDILQQVEAAAADDRNFVKKAVNWALRQIGKRNAALNDAAIMMAHELTLREESAARWIGRDALRELESEKIQQMIARRGERK